MFSQQLVTRAPSLLTSESCSLIHSYTSCHANWMLQMQSRCYLCCRAIIMTSSCTLAFVTIVKLEWSQYQPLVKSPSYVSPFYTMCLNSTLCLYYTLCLSFTSASLSFIPHPSQFHTCQSQFHTTRLSFIPPVSVSYLPVCPALHSPVQRHLPYPEDPPNPDQAVVSKQVEHPPI